MSDFHERTRLLIGEEALARIQSKSLFIAGLGGVGGYIAEALVRTGMEHITIHDADIISESNINRQIIALHSTIGRKKTDVMRERLLDINPDCHIAVQDGFITKEVMPTVLSKKYDIVVDAIDIFNCKLAFLRYAYNQDCWLYSSMGAGNRIDPTKITSGDLFESKNCRLAKVLRKKLRHTGITEGIKAVWSEEIGHAPGEMEEGKDRTINASISTIPGIFGLTLAGIVIKDLVNNCY
ncbi:MAG: tRNA threonylcarbamoyladenosine dehydratase [Proteobacteria bacterium]|nr:tRNA threonylcarbamoyladenosine dehydratase [Pseudomonadota bacterium]